MIYIENRGDGRSYLRLTPLAVILVVGLTLISLATLFVFLLLRSRPGASEPVNVNITPRSPSPYSTDKPIIRQIPPRPSPPKVVHRPGYGTPAPSTPKSDENTNERIVPVQTPRPSPSESPP